MHRALEEADHVDRRQRDARTGHDRVHDLGLEDPGQDQELPDEVGRSRHRQRRQRDDQEQRRQHRCAHRETAHPPQVVGAPDPRGEQRDDEEQRHHHEPVVDHLDDRSLGALVPQREDAERDEPELRDRRVPDDQRRGLLRERHHRPVQDARHRDHQHQLLERDAARRETPAARCAGTRTRRPSTALRRGPRPRASARLVYAPGIQACSGKAGIFTRNASAKHRKIHSCVPSESRRWRQHRELERHARRRAGVARIPVATAAASISRLPTSV